MNFRSFLFALVLFVSPSLLLAEELQNRLWESSQGTEIEADLVFTGEQIIVLRKDDGTEVAIRIDQLSARSQALLEEPSAETEEVVDGSDDAPVEASQDAPESVEVSPVPALLPVSMESTEPGEKQLSVFTEGRWKGKHAVYEHEKFDAVVGEKGRCSVFLKGDDGARLSVAPQFIFVADAPREDGVHRKYSWSSCDDVAALQPKEISIRSAAHCDIEDGDVFFETTFSFEENTISFRAHLEKSRLDTPSRLHHAVVFPRPFDLDSADAATMDQAEAQELVGDSSVLFSGGEGDAISMPLWDGNEPEMTSRTIHAGHYEVAVNLAPFHPRSLKFSTDPDTFDSNRPQFFGTDSRALGFFGIVNRKIDRYSDEKDEWIKVTIE